MITYDGSVSYLKLLEPSQQYRRFVARLSTHYWPQRLTSGPDRIQRDSSMGELYVSDWPLAYLRPQLRSLGAEVLVNVRNRS